MQYFKRLDDKQYKAASGQFTGETALQTYELFNNWIATSADKYFEHKDATHLNRVLEGAKSRGVYRDYLSFAKGVAAHEFKGGQFVGKMDSTKMFTQSQTNDDGVLVWEQSLYDLLIRLSAKAVDKESAKAEPIDKIKAGTRMKALFSAVGKAGMTLEDMDAIYFDIRAEFEASKLPAVKLAVVKNEVI